MRAKDVLFVFDQPGAWTRYRCDHQAEQLGFLGGSSDIVQSVEIDLTEAANSYDCFVFNRVEWRDELAQFFERARSRNRTVLFDTDDLIFEPDLIDHFAVFAGWPAAERKAEIERLDRYRRTLEACGCAIVTTEPLRKHAGRHADRAEVVFNAVSEKMVRLADRALASPATERDSDEVALAYLSGTSTHNRDFLEAADAVLWALEVYPQCHFLAVGKLKLDQRFERFGHRVERVPMQPWQGLPDLLVRIDVNLAPLEPNNPVTDCKSCVKYLEAGLLGVPTVASARPDFVRVLEQGRNGLLADTPTEWQNALRQLVESQQLRRQIGERASEDVRRNHTTSARAKLLGEALKALGSAPRGSVPT